MEKDEIKLIEKVDFTFDIFPVEEKKEKATSKKAKNERVIFEGSNKVVLKKKFYIGFKTRVTALVVSIIVLLLVSAISFLMIYKASKNYIIKYSETSNINYSVCDSLNSCIKEKEINGFLASNCSYVDTNFIYNVDVSDLITYDISYYIDSVFVIRDKRDKNVVLYRKAENILDEQRIKSMSDNININEKIKIDYKDYYNKVLEYNTKNGVDVEGDLVVSLYMKDSQDTTKISSIKFNLSDKIFNPRIKTTNNLDKSVSIEKDAWTDTNKILALICIVCGLIVLFLIIRLSNLLIKSFYRKDKYTKEVNQILRQYDEDIVVARDGYNSLENKRVVKVSEFKELLDAKNILKKPIVYVRVNDIKSKFIVEDVECIYEYTIKDLDF